MNRAAALDITLDYLNRVSFDLIVTHYCDHGKNKDGGGGGGRGRGRGKGREAAMTFILGNEERKRKVCNKE